MRYIFSLFILWIIIVNISANNNSLKEKIDKMATSIREVKIGKELLRILQSTDEISDTDFSPGNTTDGPEDGDAEEPNYFVPANKTVSSEPAETKDKDNGIQILRLFGINVNKNHTTFGLSAFFYNRPISSMVIFRLRVRYNYKTGEYEDIPEDAGLEEKQQWSYGLDA